MYSSSVTQQNKSRWTLHPSDVRVCDEIRGVFVRVLTRDCFGVKVEGTPDATELNWGGYRYVMYTGIQDQYVTLVVLEPVGDNDIKHFFEARFERARLGKIKKSALILAKKIINRPIREVMLV